MINHYKNLGGNSSVIAYEILPNAIKVCFKGGKWYSYSYAKAGRPHVEYMKKIADRGFGLCSYIQRTVRNLYD